MLTTGVLGRGSLVSRYGGMEWDQEVLGGKLAGLDASGGPCACIGGGWQAEGVEAKWTARLTARSAEQGQVFCNHLYGRGYGFGVY